MESGLQPIQWDRGTVYQKVALVLVEALNVEKDEITPAATLQEDLGAEPIDFLEIMFRLEREFGINIPCGQFFPKSVFQIEPKMVFRVDSICEYVCRKLEIKG